MSAVPESTWRALGKLRYGVVAVVVVIGLLLVVLLVGSASQPGGDAGVGTELTAASVSADALRASGFAEDVVNLFLRAGEDRAAALEDRLDAEVDLSGVVSGLVWPLRTSALDVHEVGEGYWSVLVTADVLVLGSDGEWSGAAEGLAYRVGVGVTEEGAVATGLPSRVELPVQVGGPQLLVRALGTDDVADPVVVAASDWLRGELTPKSVGGDGAVEPVAGWVPFATVPYTDLDISHAAYAAASEGLTVVRLSGSGSTPGGRREAVEYSVGVEYDALYATHRVVEVFEVPPGPGYVPETTGGEPKPIGSASGTDGGGQRSVWGIVLVLVVVLGSAWWIGRRVQVGTSPPLPVVVDPGTDS